MEALDAQIVELTPNLELEEEIGRAGEYFEWPRRDATREAARGDELTHEATGDDTHVFPDGDEHIRDSAHEPTRPSYQYRSDTRPGGAAACGKVKLAKMTLPHLKANPIN